MKTEPPPNDIAIYPCRSEELGTWFCEITFTESGKTWFCSSHKRTRRAAVSAARAEIAEKAKVRKQKESAR